MSFKFKTYEVTDLDDCGRAFVRDFNNSILSSYPKWSAAIFDWFRASAPSEIQVFPPSPDKRGEFIVDLSHTTYPVRQAKVKWSAQDWINMYERAFQTSCQIKLALESEFGKGSSSRNGTFVHVLDEGCKLAVVKANVKMMVFATYNNKERSRVPDALQKLRSSHGDSSPWLWLDIPNPHAMPHGPRDVRFGLFR